MFSFCLVEGIGRDISGFRSNERYASGVRRNLGAWTLVSFGQRSWQDTCCSRESPAKHQLFAIKQDTRVPRVLGNNDIRVFMYWKRNPQSWLSNNE